MRLIFSSYVLVMEHHGIQSRCSAHTWGTVMTLMVALLAAEEEAGRAATAAAVCGRKVLAHDGVGAVLTTLQMVTMIAKGELSTG